MSSARKLSSIGSRIRERRMLLGTRQSALAKQIGISPAYLNLIEHDRRRIGGKLLLDIAERLEIDPNVLREGAEAALVSELHHAEADASDVAVEHERADEFAGRFPGWAQLVSAQHREIGSLRSAVETLNDRLSHDPFLADAIHEILSTVTAIQSSASILVEAEDIEKEWRDRFQRNIFEDSSRLSETSQLLVGYLDPGREDEFAPSSAEEELDRFLKSRNYSFSELDENPATEPAAVVENETFHTPSAKQAAIKFMTQYRESVARLSDSQLFAIEAQTEDPSEIARMADVPVTEVMMRLAFRAPGQGRAEFGYVVADASGALLLKRPITGFAMPSLGQACPLWPLFKSLSRPLVPIREPVIQIGRDSVAMASFAIALPVETYGYGEEPRYHAHMLVKAADTDQVDPQSVGVNCRICSVADCQARREASILSDGF
ncbi:MAG: helix-turn-helix domain-containing protein [Paracoccaceae bacterium]|nr:helix-turn-helix domain-containing protein [Paracoccaceae bacterium]MDP7186645.1 helix-turn-helix domain-containing protein [Paracoccaceae bacterium]